MNPAKGPSTSEYNSAINRERFAASLGNITGVTVNTTTAGSKAEIIKSTFAGMLRLAPEKITLAVKLLGDAIENGKLDPFLSNQDRELINNPLQYLNLLNLKINRDKLLLSVQFNPKVPEPAVIALALVYALKFSEFDTAAEGLKKIDLSKSADKYGDIYKFADSTVSGLLRDQGMDGAITSKVHRELVSQLLLEAALGSKEIESLTQLQWLKPWIDKHRAGNI